LKTGALEADFNGFPMGVETDQEFDLAKAKGSSFAAEMEGGNGLIKWHEGPLSG